MKSQAGVSLEARDPFVDAFKDTALVEVADLCERMDRIDVCEGDFIIVLVSSDSFDSTEGNSSTGLLGLSSMG